jgi:hypothetical protein
MGGSQFTMTLSCAVVWDIRNSQTPEIENGGNGSHSRFPGFRFANSLSHPQDKVMVNWDPPPLALHPCRMEAGAGSDHDGTRNMSRAINLLYLFRYQIGGDLSVHKFTNEIYS